jgi:hypothetical protein
MEPFQEQFVVTLDAGVANGGEFMTVPLGKRAVIEHVSVFADPPPLLQPSTSLLPQLGHLGLQRSSDFHCAHRDGCGRWKSPMRAYADKLSFAQSFAGQIRPNVSWPRSCWLDATIQQTA